MKKYLSKFGAWLSVLPMLLAPSIVFGAEPNPAKFLTGEGAGGAVAGNAVKSALGTGTQSLPIVVGNLINVLISVLGIVFVVLIVYAGYLYLTAAGEEKKVTKAKTLIGQAVIGLVLILAAYSISTFVIQEIGGVAKSGG